MRPLRADLPRQPGRTRASDRPTWQETPWPLPSSARAQEAGGREGAQEARTLLLLWLSFPFFLVLLFLRPHLNLFIWITHIVLWSTFVKVLLLSQFVTNLAFVRSENRTMLVKKRLLLSCPKESVIPSLSLSLPFPSLPFPSLPFLFTVLAC